MTNSNKNKKKKPLDLYPELNDEDQSPNKLRTLAQAAAYLNVEEHTLHNHFYRSDKAEPTPTRIGGRVYFSETSLDSMVNKHTLKPNRKLSS